MYLKVVCLIIILILFSLFEITKSSELFTQQTSKIDLFNGMMDNHYALIFPNNANRNAAGFKFFQYIYDNLATSEHLFDTYNQFYCSVSGSIVSPDRQNNFDILKVSNLENQCVLGKYYRCCTPCNCDIMKYAKVINTKIEMPKNSGNYIYRNLLTIGDPCNNPSLLPTQIDNNVFKCNNGVLQHGYRVNSLKELTQGPGRLVIGVLYPIDSENVSKVDVAINMCITGTERLLTPPENLVGGMGDIFVNIALINNDRKYTHTIDDLCSN